MSRRDAASFALPAVFLVVLSSANGGYFPVAWGWSALALGGFAIAGLALGEELPRGRWEWVTVGGLAAVAALSLVSALWADDPSAAVLGAERVVLYPLAIFVALIWVRPASLPWFLGGMLGAISVVALDALLQWLAGGADDAIAHGQAYAPIGYWNGLAALCVVGVLLAAGFALRPGWTPLRAAAAAAVVLQLLVMALTESRAAPIALLVGLIVLAALLRPRAVAGAGAVALVVVALLLPAAAAARSSNSEVSLTGRPTLWGVAIDQWRAHPVLGGGAGNWELAWDARRRAGHNIGNPNSLYFETLGELGLVGLIALGAGLAAPLLRIGSGRARHLPAAAAAAYAALVLHLAVDFDWQLPAVAIAGLWCGAALLLAARRDEPRSPPRTRPVLLGVVILVTLLAAVGLAGNRQIARAADAIAAGNPQAARTAASAASRWMPWSYLPDVWQGEAALAGGDPEAAQLDFRNALATRHGTRNWRLWFDLSRTLEGPDQVAALRRVVALNPRSPEVATLCRAGDPQLAAFCLQWRQARRR